MLKAMNTACLVLVLLASNYQATLSYLHNRYQFDDYTNSTNIQAQQQHAFFNSSISITSRPESSSAPSTELVQQQKKSAETYINGPLQSLGAYGGGQVATTADSVRNGYVVKVSTPADSEEEDDVKVTPADFEEEGDVKQDFQNSERTLVNVTTPADSEEDDDVKVTTPADSEEDDDVKVTTPADSEEDDDVKVTTPADSEEYDDVKVTTPADSEEDDDVKVTTPTDFEEDDDVKVTTPADSEEDDDVKVTTPTDSEEDDDVKVTTPTDSEEDDDVKVTTPADTEEDDDVKVTTPADSEEDDDVKVTTPADSEEDNYDDKITTPNDSNEEADIVTVIPSVQSDEKDIFKVTTPAESDEVDGNITVGSDSDDADDNVTTNAPTESYEDDESTTKTPTESEEDDNDVATTTARSESDEVDDVSTGKPNLCEGCEFQQGVCYNRHPSDCTLFIQCRLSAITHLPEVESVQSCPHGQYWNQLKLTCDFQHNVKCVDDICLGNKTIKISGASCRGVWDCSSGTAVAKCCPESFAYNLATADCSYQPSCQDSCLSVVERNKCVPELDLPFDVDAQDKSGRNVWVKNEGVLVKYGKAFFDGHSRLTVNHFSNAWWGATVYVQVRYKPLYIGGVELRQALVSNGDSQLRHSLGVCAGPMGVDFYAETQDSTQPANFTVPYDYSKFDDSGWHNVMYRLDDNTLYGSLNNNTMQTPAKGVLESLQRSLVIGSGGGCKDFEGFIDELTVYFCRPEL